MSEKPKRGSKKNPSQHRINKCAISLKKCYESLVLIHGKPAADIALVRLVKHVFPRTP